MAVLNVIGLGLAHLVLPGLSLRSVSVTLMAALLAAVIQGVVPYALTLLIGSLSG
jgi:hypothetical protein